MDFVPYDAHRIRFTLLNYNYDDYEPHYGNFNRTPRIFHRPNQVGVLHYAWTASPSLVNELVVSGSTDHVFINIDTSKGLYDRTQYGINYPFLYSAATKTIPNKIPTIGISNFGTLDGGPYPSHSGGIVYGIGDNVTKVLGNHTLKAGFNFEYAGENNFDQISVSSTVPGATNNQNGFFRFTDTRNGLKNNGIAASTGKAVANSAVGLFDTYGEIGQRSYTLYRGTMYEASSRTSGAPAPTSSSRLASAIPHEPLLRKVGQPRRLQPLQLQPRQRRHRQPTTDIVTGGDRYNGVVIPGSGFPSSAAGPRRSCDIRPASQNLFRGFSAMSIPPL